MKFNWLEFACHCFLVLCCVCGASGIYAAERQTVYVAVASSLRFAWQPWIDKAMQSYAEGTDSTVVKPVVRVTYGASGNLSRQILQGAPHTLFVSANKAYADRVAKQRQHVSENRLVVAGQLAWVTRRNARETLLQLMSGNTTAGRDQLDGSGATIAIPGGKIPAENIVELALAIANPRHAPYGEAAVELLQSYGLAGDDFSTLLAGENAAHALHFLKSGGADLALAPVSLLTNATDDFEWVVADATLYQPVAHHILMIEADGPSGIASRELFERLLSKNALATLQDFGLLSGNRF